MPPFGMARWTIFIPCCVKVFGKLRVDKNVINAVLRFKAVIANHKSSEFLVD